MFFSNVLFVLFWIIHSFLYFCSADPVSVRQTPHRNHVHKQSEKTTRVRTVLNEKQLHTLRTCYNANPRPDALMKEQLVEMTGLSPRVIRVWFQNKRCKDKKRSIFMKQLQQQHGDTTVSVLLMHIQCEKCSLQCAEKNTDFNQYGSEWCLALDMSRDCFNWVCNSTAVLASSKCFEECFKLYFIWNCPYYRGYIIVFFLFIKKTNKMI